MAPRSLKEILHASSYPLAGSVGTLVDRYRAHLIAKQTGDTHPRAASTQALPATVLAVYRYDNAPLLGAFLNAQGLDPKQLRLWALDRVHPDFENVTLGAGAGGKFDLLNGLLEHRPIPDEHYVVILDDDTLLTRGDLARFLQIVDEASLGLAQPAHAVGSYWNHPITRRRLWSVARLTTYVEIGPFFAISPSWRSRIVPFPTDIGLGFTLDLKWPDLRHEGCRLGIVDDVRLVHCAPAGRAYDWDAEHTVLVDYLATVGVSSPWELHHDLGTWRPWSSRPPWL